MEVIVPDVREETKSIQVGFIVILINIQLLLKDIFAIILMIIAVIIIIFIELFIIFDSKTPEFYKITSQASIQSLVMSPPIHFKVVTSNE